MDFTQNTYRTLLQALQAQGFSFITFAEYINYYKNKDSVASGIQDNEAQSTNQPAYRRQSGNQSILPDAGRKLINQSTNQSTIILRHDVDLKPQNSLATAKMEHELGIKGSYYFRMVPESYDTKIIRQIAELGHEVGYHYETMDTAGESLKYKDELIDAAYQQFCENLEEFRQIADVKTICMHGSPRSKYDNRDIWTKYSYRELGIIGEPYFDINFDDLFYLTDTGRRWDGHKVSIRDKMPQQGQWDSEGLTFRSTKDIIKAANEERLPHQIMITVHPQRWSNSFFSWTKEFVLQNLKNVVKGVIVKGS